VEDNKIINKINKYLHRKKLCEGIQRVVQVQSVHDFFSRAKPILFDETTAKRKCVKTMTIKNQIKKKKRQ
jgi:hypothetical protein